MKRVISMNLRNVIQMKPQCFGLTVLLVLLGVFSAVNTNAAEKVNGRYQQSEHNPAYSPLSGSRLPLCENSDP